MPLVNKYRYAVSYIISITVILCMIYDMFYQFNIRVSI